MEKGYLKQSEELNAYEELINQSILFEIDKDKEPVAYSNEYYKLVRNIASYLFLKNEKGNAELGEEIMQTAVNCVKAYDPSMGFPILHYCNAAWSKNRKRAYVKIEQFNNLGNVHYSKKLMQTIHKYVRLAEKNHRDCFSESYISFISDSIGHPEDEILDYMRLLKEGIASTDIETEDGDELSILDYDLAKKFLAGTAGNDAEQLIQIQDFAEKINQVFLSLQERQRGYIAGLITIRILDEKGMNDAVISTVAGYDFFDKEIARRILTNERVTARIIAAEYDTSEQSISRGYREFLEKLRKVI